MNLQSAPRILALAALALAGATLNPAGAADYGIHLLGDDSLHFTGLVQASGEGSADGFLAAYRAAYGASGGTWTDVVTRNIEMPEKFVYGVVPFEKVETVRVGPVEVLLFRDTVEGEKAGQQGRIHAFAVDRDQLDGDPIAWLNTVAWARDQASTKGWALGSRQMVIALAARVRSQRGAAIAEAVVEKFLAKYGDGFTNELEGNSEDWDYYSACWQGLAGVSVSVDAMTFSDAGKASDIFEHVKAAMDKAFQVEGNALLNLRIRRIQRENARGQGLQARPSSASAGEVEVGGAVLGLGD